MKGIPMEHEKEVVVALEKRFEELILNEDAWSIVTVDPETGTIVKRAPSDNVLIRIQTIMPFPAPKVMAYLRRFEERPKWDATCEQFRVVSQSRHNPHVRYVYYRSYGKWMVSPRDGYMLVAEKIKPTHRKKVHADDDADEDVDDDGSGVGVVSGCCCTLSDCTCITKTSPSLTAPSDSNPLDEAIYQIVSCSAPDTPHHEGCIRMDNYLSATAVIPVTKGPAASNNLSNTTLAGSCTQLIQICDWSLNGYIPNWLVHRLLTRYIPQSVKQLMEQISNGPDSDDDQLDQDGNDKCDHGVSY